VIHFIRPKLKKQKGKPVYGLEIFITK